MKPPTPVATQDHERPIPPEPIPPKPPEAFKAEEPHIFEKPTFLPTKPIPHSPKISPSSIPIPNPSVTTTKQVESGYPNYGGYLYSIPGYSAFQPVNHSGMPGYHPGLVQQNQTLPPERQNPDFPPFSEPPIAPSTKEPIVEEESMDTDALLMVTDDEESQQPLPQTDFEEHFTPEIISTIPTVKSPEVAKPTESKMSITSLAQGSGATVTIPSPSKEIKKKSERFSLKTSIPISKIDMKCVSNPPDCLFQNSSTKKTFTKDPPRVEIQSNIVIKSATKEPEAKESPKPVIPVSNSNISTLINAAEAINKTENQFRIPEVPKSETSLESKNSAAPTKPLFNPMNIETSQANFTKTTDREPYSSDAKNQILFVQNKNNNNTQSPKMLLTIQQQNPQVLLQRTNFESKNLQAPSRPSNQNKKTKEDVINESASSKVVALKRLHQENCDENDFENLITENQIYGNKIVVKEKSQGTLQEQDLKNKKTVTEKVTTSEAKNVVLQPNFLYLSNVQFPNMMIVKNNTKVNQTTDNNKARFAQNENKIINETNNFLATAELNIGSTLNKTLKGNTPAINKEIHVLKSNNNVIQTVQNKTKSDIPKLEMVTKLDNIMVSTSENILIKSEMSKSKSDIIISKPDIVITKPELVFQTNQKVIVNPQMVYQVPISSIVEADKINPLTIMNISSKDYPKFIAPKQEYTKPFEQATTNDKLYIACPYQMDSKLQPKIVITNLKPKINKLEEISSLDIYEKRRRLRRLKYLSNRESNATKEAKTETNCTSVVTQSLKKAEKSDLRNANIITPDKMNREIYKEFASAKGKLAEASSCSDSDDGDELESKLYESIIEEYGDRVTIAENEKRKCDFLSNFKLASPEYYKEKELDLQERMLQHDKVRSAYAAVGRLDALLNVSREENTVHQRPEPIRVNACIVGEQNLTMARKKTMFLSHLKLTQTTQRHKEEYEKAWEVILKERQRRNVTADKVSHSNITWPSIYLQTKGQLEIMTEIKQSVNENNNLIKKMLDTVREKQANEESISVLAEKNFSELNRLSKMADQSVKLVSGQNKGKRDLNPGFDSENIQLQDLKIEQPFQNYPKLKIPSISKIISLKSTQECRSGMSTQATSMDEPHSSAAGVTEMFVEIIPDSCKTVDMCCQVEENIWPGIDKVVQSYRDYEAARRREISELHRRNTTLRVEGAHITRAASRDSDRARALLAERQNLAMEENNLRMSLQRLRAAIDEVKNYTGLHDFC
ncbi:unnamed protein product [Arctia plantaginis]|uniref:Uncharacterized protein n=1 Tax=Arctia plantaginis TaxID=874455 RepID=A0A8S1AJH7_ARCPL|nr:unnamed protein product [Arctia plantaginis]